MGKTGHINLSNQELRYFVEANSRLTTLTNEANYLNGNLREENSRTKEDARTALGAFHSALALNHELSQSNDKEVLENVLKLMHNSAMRIIEFFEHVVKTNPSTEVKEEDKNAEIVIRKDIYDKAIYYCIQQKNGKNITVAFYKDTNTSTNDFNTYRIEYSDSPDSYSKVQTEPGKELRSSEENLEFYAQYNYDDFKLKSLRAHSYDHHKSSDSQISNLVRNIETAFKALEKAEENTPLERLNLNRDTEYIKKLYQTLEKNLGVML